MGKQVVVIGLGRFGARIAAVLSEKGHEVLGLDIDEHKVQGATTKITHAVQADATDEDVLSELGVKNFDIAVVAIGSNIQSNVLAVVQLKSLGVPYLIARAGNKSHGEILRKIGADRVVFPEDDAGHRLAHGLLLHGVSDYMPVNGAYGIINIDVQDELVGQTLADLDIGPKGRERTAALLIQRGNEVLVTPSMSEKIKAHDRLVISGTDGSLESFLKRIVAMVKSH